LSDIGTKSRTKLSKQSRISTALKRVYYGRTKVSSSKIDEIEKGIAIYKNHRLGISMNLNARQLGMKFKK